MNDELQESRLARLIVRQAQKRHLAALWAAAAGVAPGMRLLDIGAGSGALSFEYAALVGAAGRVVALDPDEECIGYIATEARRRDLPIDAIVGSAEALPAFEFAPDRIMLTDALHHMNDPAVALAALRAIIPPHGVLFIAEYDPAGPGAVGAKLARRTSPDRVASWLGAAGFSVGAHAAAPDEHYTFIATP